jgi:hypothetical protein
MQSQSNELAKSSENHTSGLLSIQVHDLTAVAGHSTARSNSGELDSVNDGLIRCESTSAASTPTSSGAQRARREYNEYIQKHGLQAPVNYFR